MSGVASPSALRQGSVKVILDTVELQQAAGAIDFISENLGFRFDPTI